METVPLGICVISTNRSVEIVDHVTPNQFKIYMYHAEQANKQSIMSKSRKYAATSEKYMWGGAGEDSPVDQIDQ